MGWSIGYDDEQERDIGYGVPAKCDHPDCDEDIDRGLGYVCGGDPYGGEHGCGLYFCGKHLLMKVIDDRTYQLCERCYEHNHGSDEERPERFNPKPDTEKWIRWKLTDDSWAQWREENPDFVQNHKHLLGTALNSL